MKNVLLIVILLATFAIQSPIQASELTLYFIKPSLPLNWSSPVTLAWSLFKVTKKKLPSQIGHTHVELNCDSEEGASPIHYFAGITMAAPEEPWHKFDEGYGLGTLLLDYTGALYPIESFLANRDEYTCEPPAEYLDGIPLLNFFRIRISNSTCRRLNQFFKEYQEKGLHNIYGGLASHPLYGGGGASCSVFAMSFLEVGGLFTEEMDRRWMQRVILPYSSIGDPESGDFVSPWEVLLRGFHWAKDAKQGIPVEIPDPALMHRWVLEKIATHDSSYSKENLCTYGYGITIDRTDSPTPSGPIWSE